MTVRGGLPEIPSNFNINDWLDVNPEYDSWCQTVAMQGGIRSAEGKLRFICAVNDHLNYDDCIVYPGKQGAAHLHHYYGNTLTDYRSTYETLRTTGDSSCQGGPLIRTAYWFPAMIRPASADFPVAKVVRPDHAQLYYGSTGALTDFVSPNKDYPHTNFGVRPFPNGLQIVTGWEHRHPMPPPFRVWGWDHQAFRFSSDGWNSFGTLPDMYAAADPTTRDDPPGIGADGYHFTGQIIARISTPTFWDGVNLRENPVVHPHASGHGPGRSHLSWGFQDMYGNVIGPPTHPYRIPSVAIIINWPWVKGWQDWYLSVDRHNNHNLPGGYGFHADWFGAMDPTVQTINEEEHMALHTRDPNGVKTSSMGILCRNNSGLTWRNVRKMPDSERYIDIPPPPVVTPPPVVIPPDPPPAPAPAYTWQSYKSGKTTLYKILEGSTLRVNSISLAECRWLCGVLKIKAP